MDLWFDEIDSPVGTIVVVSDGENLCALDFGDYGERMHRLMAARYGEVRLIRAENPQGFSERVRAYLAGDMASLDDIPVSTGGTPFQAQVWAALRSIPAGTTITYGELAARVGRPTAARAVGMTNSLNPIAIVLPCHRVIGANASLTGYAGGLERKRWLLEHEGAYPKAATPAALQERLAV